MILCDLILLYSTTCNSVYEEKAMPKRQFTATRIFLFPTETKYGSYLKSAPFFHLFCLNSTFTRVPQILSGPFYVHTHRHTAAVFHILKTNPLAAAENPLCLRTSAVSNTSQIGQTDPSKALTINIALTEPRNHQYNRLMINR